MDSPRIRRTQAQNAHEDKALRSTLSRLAMQSFTVMGDLSRNQAKFEKRYASHLPPINGAENPKGERAGAGSSSPKNSSPRMSRATDLEREVSNASGESQSPRTNRRAKLSPILTENELSNAKDGDARKLETNREKVMRRSIRKLRRVSSQANGIGGTGPKTLLTRSKTMTFCLSSDTKKLGPISKSNDIVSDACTLGESLPVAMAAKLEQMKAMESPKISRNVTFSIVANESAPSHSGSQPMKQLSGMNEGSPKMVRNATHSDGHPALSQSLTKNEKRLKYLPSENHSESLEKDGEIDETGSPKLAKTVTFSEESALRSRSREATEKSLQTAESNDDSRSVESRTSGDHDKENSTSPPAAPKMSMHTVATKLMQRQRRERLDAFLGSSSESLVSESELNPKSIFGSSADEVASRFARKQASKKFHRVIRNVFRRLHEMKVDDSALDEEDAKGKDIDWDAMKDCRYLRLPDGSDAK